MSFGTANNEPPELQYKEDLIIISYAKMCHSTLIREMQSHRFSRKKNAR